MENNIDILLHYATDILRCHSQWNENIHLGSFATAHLLTSILRCPSKHFVIIIILRCRESYSMVALFVILNIQAYFLALENWVFPCILIISRNVLFCTLQYSPFLTITPTYGNSIQPTFVQCSIVDSETLPHLGIPEQRSHINIKTFPKLFQKFHIKSTYWCS